MAISGLVIRLSENAAAATRAVGLLNADSRFELGERMPRMVAAVLETNCAREDQAAWRFMLDLEGIEGAELTFVSLDQAPGSPMGPTASGHGTELP